MKTLSCILILAAVAAAEPPRYRLARFRSARQELSEGGEKESKGEEAPYPAAGFKPNKEFNLPSRKEAFPPATSYGTPDDSYGAPFKTYTAPQTEYGVPRKSEGSEKSENGEKEEKKEKVEKEGGEEKGEKKEKSEGSEKSEVESLKEGKSEKKLEKLQEGPKNDAEVVNTQGAYYVLLPTSELQRIQFQTENDLRNMAYTARLQYRNEDRAPLYVYSAVPQYPSSAYVQYF